MASEAAKVAEQHEVDKPAGLHPTALGRTASIGDGDRASLVTEPGSLRMVTTTYSIGRVAIPAGSRPASTQPMSVAATGMAITMRNRLLHGM